MNREDIRVGQDVHYAPEHGKKENGRVKSITPQAVFIVYNCGGDWEHYKEYTAANTNPRDLRPGWVDANGNIPQEECDHEYRNASYKWGPINRMECIHCGKVIND